MNNGCQQQEAGDVTASPAFCLWGQRLLAIAMAIGLFWLMLLPVESYDLWFHLATGRQILHTHAIPRFDPFSYTAPGPWQNHEWLADVFLYALFSLANLPGLIVAKAALVSLTFSFLFVATAPRSQYQGATSFLFTLVAFAASVGSLDVRPEIASLVLFSLFVLYWNALKQQPNALVKWRRTLPPLMMLWANCHGGFIAGLVFFGLGVAAEGVAHRRGRSPRLGPAALREAACLWLACIVACLVNPYGWRVFAYPLNYALGSEHYATTRVIEWLPPDLTQFPTWAFALLLASVLALLVCRRRFVYLSDVALLLIFGAVSVLHRRSIPYFALAAIPVASSLMGTYPEMIERLKGRHRRKALVAVLCGGWLVFSLWAGTRLSTLRKQPIRKELFPSEAAQFILMNHLPQPMFNEYRFGGFLIWKLHPYYKVFIDGRADVYGESLLREYDATISARNTARDNLRRYGINMVVISNNTELARRLESDSNWQHLYRDDTSVIYLRRNPENERFISAWKQDRLQYPSSAGVAFYRGLDCLRNGLAPKAEMHWKECIARDARYADAYTNLGTLEAQRGNLNEAIRLWEKSLRLSPGTDPQVYRNLGKAYSLKSNTTAAARYYRQANQLEAHSVRQRAGQKGGSTAR